MLASAFCLCIRRVGTHKRSPASFPLPDTRRCSTCPTLSRMNRAGVHTSLLFQKPFSFPPNFGSGSDDPSPNASLHERLFLYRKEHLATVVRTVGAIDGNALFSVTRLALVCGRLWRKSVLFGSRELRCLTTLRVSNCEQMFADSGVILCVHSVGSETKTVISLLSRFLVAAVQALAVSSSESDYIRSRIKQINPPRLRDPKEQR